jgi:hypothetical protein
VYKRSPKVKEFFFSYLREDLAEVERSVYRLLRIPTTPGLARAAMISTLIEAITASASRTSTRKRLPTAKSKESTGEEDEETEQGGGTTPRQRDHRSTSEDDYKR